MFDATLHDRYYVMDWANLFAVPVLVALVLAADVLAKHLFHR